MPLVGAARIGRRRLGHEGLHLADERTLAVERDRHGRAGHRSGTLIAEQPGRIGDAFDSVVVQPETTDLVRRAEPVLHPAHHSQVRRPLALEVQDDVDEVLEAARACDGALLRHVPDENHGDAGGLGRRRQRGGHRAHLGDATRHALGLGGGHRLHRVDHHQRRPNLVDVTECGLEVRLGGEVQLVVAAAGSLGAKPDLASRLLSRQVQRPAPGLGPAVRDLEQQRRLADTGIAREQRHRAGHHAAAQDAVQLGDARMDVPRATRLDGADRHRG